MSRPKLRHPFYPELKLVPAATAGDCPAMCGVLEDLLDAASAGVRIERAVFPIRLASDPFLAEADRDLLWHSFQTPVYSLLLDQEGELLGYECEAQDGLHVVRPIDLPFGRLETATCECGRPGLRIVPVSAPSSALQDELLAS